MCDDNYGNCEILMKAGWKGQLSGKVRIKSNLKERVKFGKVKKRGKGVKNRRESPGDSRTW